MQNAVLIAIVFAASFSLGTVRVLFAERALFDPTLSANVGRSMVIEGVVADDPDARDTSTLLTLHAVALGGVPVNARVRLTTARYPEFSYGDRVRVTGKLALPASFKGDNGRMVDYPRTLAVQGVGYVMAFPRIEKIGAGGGSRIIGLLYGVKHAFLASIGRSVPEPEGALVGGVLLGTRTSMGQRLLDTLRNAGVLHVIALSGYNVTIVAEAFMRAFSFLPRVTLAAFGGVGIVSFVLMTGASSTAVRASIMALLVIVARLTGRPYDLLRGLIIAGVGMVVWNPYTLLYDLSFQLSFLATLGLIVLAPRLERRFTGVPQVFGIRSILASTISAELFVLPLLLFSLGNASIVGVATNLFVLPIVPLLMLTGALAGMFGLISAPLGVAFGFLAYACAAYFLFVAGWFGSLPFALFTLP
ncbi:MAG: ComEC/Rec2 family competence protein [Minisyncoccota bacterium]